MEAHAGGEELVERARKASSLLHDPLFGGRVPQIELGFVTGRTLYPDCIFKIILSLQLWRPIQRLKDRVLLDEMVVLSRSFFTSSYTPPPASSSQHVAPASA
jgi:hypothetical protein